MLSSPLWQHGLAWLTLSHEHWPAWSAAATFLTQSTQTSEPALETIESNTAPIQPTIHSCNEYGIHRIIDAAQFSRFDRLIRVTSYVLKFIERLRKRTPPTQVSLIVQETTTAEALWIQSCQQSTYKSKLDNLISRDKSGTTFVKQLRLFLDDQWGIVTPLTLADGDCNPKASSRVAGILYNRYSYTVLHVYESMITLTMLCN